MNYINHITLNTGHIRKTYPHEVDKQIYFSLRRLYKHSFDEDGVEFLDGFIAKGISDPSEGVLITIYGPSRVPILTTGITKIKNSAVWGLLHTSSTVLLKTNLAEPPEGPYIADRLEVGAHVYKDALQWTGDFSRCMGWVSLFPNEIR